ncbi:DHH family phosphoesterase [Collinsella aerofaciens]|uniref:DHH family phosphoesterase n=1 Tax=Collinsella aerofaciens TaxID=74426 RepID=UPI00359C9BC1
MTNSADLASCESADIKRRILELIEDASSIAISGHTSPDGDALGSVLGLGLSLMKVFPDKDIALLLADDDPVPRIYRFMEGADRLVPASSFTGDPDLFISVDAPVVERLNNSADVLRRSKHVVCFDHHPAREEFAEVSLRRVDAAACAMIIDRFLDDCGIVASDSIATCLLCGLVTDTGRFQYQNADAAAFHAASRLVAHGADPARVALEVYQSMRVEFLHLKSIVMGRIKTVAHGRVAYSYAYESDLKECGVTSDECDGLVDVVRSVMGVEVCLFLKGIEGDTKVRGNLRSKGDMDVSEIAANFGGGGHHAAAGFTNNGTIFETLTAALPMLAELVGEDPASVTVEL